MSKTDDYILQTKMAEAVPKDRSPITDVVSLLDDPEFKGLDALSITALFKRAEVFIESSRKKLQPAANEIFLAKYDATAEFKKLALLNGKVLVGRYTPRSDWAYPAEIVKLEAELRAKQKEAQAKGTAKKITPQGGPTLFALEVVEIFK